MHNAGWLQLVRRGRANSSPKARREYTLTPKGARLLTQLRRQVEELHHEVIEEVRER
jgi:DNA-binding PadR family transcriptional regulator